MMLFRLRKKKSFKIAVVSLIVVWIIAGLPLGPFTNYLRPEKAQAIAQGDGRIIYGQGTVATPYTRSWTGSWQDPATTLNTAAATIKHVIVKAAPTRDEMIVGIQTTGGVLYVQRWDGTTWSDAWNVTVGDGNLPRFDIAYERSTGDAIIVYSTNVGTTNEMAYNIWNGTSWAGAVNYDAVRTSGIVQGIAISTVGGTSNDMAMAWGDANLDLSANYWDGTNNVWKTEPTAALSTGVDTLAAATSLTNWSFDLDFEASGELLIAWGNAAGTDILYVTRGGGAAGAWGTVSTAAAFAEQSDDLELTADPNSDYMILAHTGSDSGNDMEVGVWNGSSFPAAIDTAAPCTNAVCVIDISVDTTGAGTSGNAAGWLTSGIETRGIVTYDDVNALGMDWASYNKNTDTWTLETDCTTACNSQPGGNDDKSHRIRQNPFNKAEFMWIGVNSVSDLFAKKLTFDGTTLTWASTEPANATLEGTVSSIAGFAADFAYNRHIPANIAPTLSVSQPDGISDTVFVGDLYNITYSLSDTDNVVTAAFYYDTDNIGLNGTAIAGACATAAEGSGVTCSWDTTGMTTGSYYIYGTTTDGINPAVSAYSSGQITISSPPTISSAANQIFEVNQVATAISPITVTDVSGGSFISTNDIRIAIATTSGFAFLWDTSDITATIGGTASAKVSTTVSYEGGGSVLVLNATSNFAAGETLTVSGLAYISFTSVKASTTGALKLYDDGVSDVVADATDTTAVTIKGTNVLANHVLGQLSDKFQNGETATTTELYRFKLTPTDETASTTLTFNLSAITGISTADITNLKIYEDSNADGRITASSSLSTAFDGANEVINAITRDTTNEVLYAVQGYDTAGDGDIYRCVLSTGCDNATPGVEWTLAFDGALKEFRAIIFDSANGVIYAGQGGAAGDGDIYRCATSTGCDVSAEWTLAFNGAQEYATAFTIDTVNNVIYAGFGSATGNGDIYRCATSTGCDVSAEWTLAFNGAQEYIRALDFDSTNGVLYAGQGSGAGDGDIYRCATSTGCDVSAEWTLAFDGAQEYIRSLTFDPTNGVVYAGLASAAGTVGDVYRCATSTACDATTDWTLAFDGGQEAIYSLGIDTSGGVIYAGQGSGTGDGDIYRCVLSTGCDNATPGVEWTLLYDGLQESIGSLMFDTTNSVLYAGQANGIGDGDMFRKTEGETEVYSSSTVSISDTTGTISLSSTSTQAIGSKNYILQATVSNIASGDAMTISLATTSIISYGNTSGLKLTVSGSASNVVHTAGTASPGTLTLSSPSSQITNTFTTGTFTNKELYAFQLIPTVEDITLSNLTIQLSDVRGLVAANITSPALYLDFNNNTIVDGGDSAVGGVGTVSLTGSAGSIAFSSGFTSTTTRSYIVRASIDPIDNGDEMTTSLPSSSITSAGVTSGQGITTIGGILPLLHRRVVASSSSSGGSSTGDAAPAGAGIQSGGTTGGGTETGTTSTSSSPQTGGGSGGGGEAYAPGLRKSFFASVWGAIAELFHNVFYS